MLRLFLFYGVLPVLIGLFSFFSAAYIPGLSQFETKLYDLRYFFRPSPSPHTDLILLSIQPQEFKEALDFLNNDLPKKHIKLLGLDTPDLYASQAPLLYKLLNESHYPIVLSNRFLPHAPPFKHHLNHTSDFLSLSESGYTNYPLDQDQTVRTHPLQYTYLPQTPSITQNNLPPNTQLSFSHQIYKSLYPKSSFPPTIYISYSNKNYKQYTLRALKSNPALLKHKIILISDPQDTQYKTPQQRLLSPSEMHANALSSLIDQSYLQAPLPENILFTLVFSLACGLLFFWGPYLGKGGIGIALASLCIGSSLLNTLLFQHWNLWLNLTSPGLCLGINSLIYLPKIKSISPSSDFITEFKRYLPQQKIEELLEHKPSKKIIQNERKLITVIFTDIQGFTKMSENLPPDRVMGLLNEYLTEMTEIIFKNNGSLDKYMGDGLMAIYGNIGKNQPQQDAYNAVKTALEMQKKMEELQRKWMTKKRKPFRIRIGIHSGEAVVGYIGHPDRKEITVIGDTVNTSAHLEKLNKTFRSQLLISQVTYQYVQEHVSVLEKGSHVFKGKAQEVKVYEVKGWKS